MADWLAASVRTTVVVVVVVVVVILVAVVAVVAVVLVVATHEVAGRWWSFSGRICPSGHGAHSRSFVGEPAFDMKWFFLQRVIFSHCA